ncbi:MAG: 50S ribosomal protein L18e [Conexivisphaerales archaeon]
MLDRIGTLKSLRKAERPVFRAALERLEGSRRRMAKVNVGKLSAIAEEGSYVLVPGKVLGSGKMEKKLIVGALDYSSEARKKIVSAGGEALTLTEFIKRYSDKEGIRLVG